MSAMLRRQRARRADEGFTLVEMIISITVMGLIATVVAAIVTTAFTNNPMNELRADVAHTLKGIVTWLPQDVDSTPPNGFDTNQATPSGCTSNPGKNLLRMEWNEATGGTVTRYVANYRWVATGGNEIIQRVTCWGTGAGTLGNTNVLNASGPLMKMTGAWAPGNLPARVLITTDPTSGDVTLVAFDVQTIQGDILHVDSAPKNPANTLPPTSAVGGFEAVTTVLATTSTLAPTTTVAPTTTASGPTTTGSGTTTTTVPATTTTVPATTTTIVPCVVSGLSMSATSLKNTDPNGNGNAAVNVGVLTSALTVTATVTGVCSGLDARSSTGAPNGELFRNFSKVNSTTFTVVFPGYPQGSSELWADGNRVIDVYSPTGAVLGSVTLVVK